MMSFGLIAGSAQLVIAFTKMSVVGDALTAGVRFVAMKGKGRLLG